MDVREFAKNPEKTLAIEDLKKSIKENIKVGVPKNQLYRMLIALLIKDCITATENKNYAELLGIVSAVKTTLEEMETLFP